jgi:hypothetical protein
VVLASGGLHVLLGLLIVADLRRPPPAPPPPVVDVWLFPRDAAATPSAKPTNKAQGQGRIRTALRQASAANPSVEGVDVSPVADGAAPVPPSPAPLRGLSGCQLAGLDRLAPEARARCLERLAVLDRPQPRLNLDLTGRYAQEQTPYMARPPKNGCKPVGGVVDDVNGSLKGKIGIGCAFSF